MFICGAEGDGTWPVASGVGDPECAVKRLLDEFTPLSGRTLHTAFETLVAASKSEPKNARWLLGLAIAALRTGDWNEAVQHAREAVRFAPKSADNHYWLARALVIGIAQSGWLQKAKLSSEAQAEFEAALAINPDYSPTCRA